MKTQLLGALCLALGAPLAFAQTPVQKVAAPNRLPARTLNVAVLVYPGMNSLDAMGPLEVFDTANGLSPRAFNIYTLAQNSSPILPSGSAYSLTPRFSFADAPRADVLVVPGASMKTIGQMEHNPALLVFLRGQSKAPQVMSVCTGSFLLARAGLLNGKRATTHWFVTSDMASQFPRVDMRQNVRYVEDGNLLTTAGVSSGIDGALRVVEKARGAAFAGAVARAMQYRPHTPAFPQVKTSLLKNAPRGGQKLALDYDPVCRMKLGPNDKTTLAYNGKIYGFCGAGCRAAFAANPAQYLKTK